MKFWTIYQVGCGTYTVKAKTFGDACERVGLNPYKARVERVANA